MKAILACDPKGGIGFKNSLPWLKLDGDLPRFKFLTNNQTVVMGKNTWLSLPKKPLPNRLNLIVSNYSLDLPSDAIQVNDISNLDGYENLWLIGGAKLFESCWNKIETVHLSRTHSIYTCDTFIDLIKLENEFTKVSTEKFKDHNYEIWKRK